MVEWLHIGGNLWFSVESYHRGGFMPYFVFRKSLWTSGEKKKKTRDININRPLFFTEKERQLLFQEVEDGGSYDWAPDDVLLFFLEAGMQQIIIIALHQDRTNIFRRANHPDCFVSSHLSSLLKQDRDLRLLWSQDLPRQGQDLRPYRQQGM
jgi:hypothetical protein